MRPPLLLVAVAEPLAPLQGSPALLAGCRVPAHDTVVQSTPANLYPRWGQTLMIHVKSHISTHHVPLTGSRFLVPAQLTFLSAPRGGGPWLLGVPAQVTVTSPKTRSLTFPRYSMSRYHATSITSHFVKLSHASLGSTSEVPACPVAALSGSRPFLTSSSPRVVAAVVVPYPGTTTTLLSVPLSSLARYSPQEYLQYTLVSYR